MGPWYGGGMGTMTATTSTINIGTLVIDMVNPADKKLVFRSQGTDTLNPSSDPDKNYKKIQKAVEKILKNFPPKPKKIVEGVKERRDLCSACYGLRLIGLVIGAVAKLLMPGKDPGGFIITMLVGAGRLFCGRLPGATDWLVQRRTACGIYHVRSRRDSSAVSVPAVYA